MLFSQASFYGRCGAVVGAIALLASCGGGGGGGGGFFPIPGPVVPPVVTKHSVGGTVSGLAGGTLVLQNNAGDDIQLTANGKFSFATAVASGSAYAVTVRTQPLWQFCTVTKGSGTIAADVGDVAVACTAAAAQVSTFAGSGSSGKADGNGTAASFSDPFSIVLNKSGELLVSDLGNNRLRKISANGDVITYAGNNSGASVDGNGIAASFNGLTAIGLAPSGDLYAAEFSGNRIRKITPAADVGPFVGNGTAGAADGNGTNATFTGPIAMTVDGAGHIYVAELNTGLIRRITPAGDVDTWVGAGVFLRPYGLVVDAAGNLLVADSGNNRIAKVTPDRVVSTFAGSNTGVDGSADGPVLSATFWNPGGLAFDAGGNLYVADTSNGALRKITPAGVVSTLAGTAGQSGFQNGIGKDARFSQPYGLTVAADGTIYVADALNNRIRKVTPVAPVAP